MEKESEARVRRGGGDDIFPEYRDVSVYFLTLSFIFPSLLLTLLDCSGSPSAVVIN